MAEFDGCSTDSQYIRRLQDASLEAWIDTRVYSDADMSFTAFYLEPRAMDDVLALVREQMPSGWRLLSPSHPTQLAREFGLLEMDGRVAGPPIRKAAGALQR